MFVYPNVSSPLFQLLFLVKLVLCNYPLTVHKLLQGKHVHVTERW